MWFDQSTYDVDVAKTRITDNTGSGIFFEISDDFLLIDSFVRATGSAQAVKLAGSSGLKLVNNTIIGGKDPVGIYVDSRSIPGCVISAANCGSAATYSSDRDSVRQRPATLDWLPRLDLMLNNVIAYPTASGLCASSTALCITANNGDALQPIQGVLHQADLSRGIPQTRMDGNVYANGAGHIIRTSSAGNFTTMAAFTSAVASAPVGISGLDANSKNGDSWVNNDGNGTPASALANASTEAIVLPSDVNINQYLPIGYKRYGYSGF